MSAVHVVPINDVRAHDESDGATCWCAPRVLEEAGGHVIVHNSADGRERWEDSRS